MVDGLNYSFGNPIVPSCKSSFIRSFHPTLSFEAALPEVADHLDYLPASSTNVETLLSKFNLDNVPQHVTEIGRVVAIKFEELAALWPFANAKCAEWNRFRMWSEITYVVRFWHRN
uniref:(northern house mosquito) hypothetical protein n=1 Tax=Culex pipiens TaxID=7175 RepID=A0A8D8P062_CULPI